jgi:glycosyltransferase involved in cell wall biosynthesis
MYANLPKRHLQSATTPKERSALRVGVDFHVVTGKFQGSRTHLIELFSALIDQSPDIDFFLFLDKPELLSRLSSAFSRANVHSVYMPVCNPITRLYWFLPRLAKRYQLDILHTQHVLSSFSGTYKRVVTIHDILFEMYPELFTAMFAARSRLLMRHAARRADHTFTVSEYSKAEICRQYGSDPSQVSVIYNGVAYDRFAMPSGQDDTILRKRGLSPKGYMLTVGRLEPRKNHVSLIRAYASLGGSPPLLVIVGQRDFKFDEIFRVIEELGISRRVRIMDDVTDDEIPAIYRHAILFAYPTIAEGFGMPVVEAMAAGVPVVTSNTTALPEVVGSTGGILVDPTNIIELSAAMNRVLNDSDLRVRLGNAGQDRARLFDWNKPALLVREQYLNLARAEGQGQSGGNRLASQAR